MGRYTKRVRFFLYALLTTKNLLCKHFKDLLHQHYASATVCELRMLAAKT